MRTKAAGWLGAMLSLCFAAAAGASDRPQLAQDISPEAAPAVQVVDAFSKAIAAGDLAAAKALLDPALVVLESGGVERSRDEYMSGHAAADAALLAGPMTVTVLRPSGLTDEPGEGTVQAAEHLRPDDWGGDRSPMVSRQDIAAIAVACAVDGLGAGRAFDIVGGSTPLLEALA